MLKSILSINLALERDGCFSCVITRNFTKRSLDINSYEEIIYSNLSYQG